MLNRTESCASRTNIALSGRSGAGKTMVADYLVSRYGYRHCNTGQVVRHVCGLLFDSESKSVMNRVSDAMRAIDENVWLRTALREQSPPVVFDSVRSRAEYQYLKEHQFQIWRVECSHQLRVVRLRERGQVFDLVNDDSHLTETDLDAALFDYHIINSGENLDGLHQKIDEAMLFVAARV